MVNTTNFYVPTTAAYYNPDTDRRVAVLTGGNSGIGWFTALHLYLHGYVTYVAGRNEKKVLAALEEIKEEAEKRVAAYTPEEAKSRFLGSLTFIKYDACDLKSVVKGAEDFAAKESKLDLLINNAGLMAAPWEMTKDGYEIQYQVNAVAPMLFTLKLFPYLENALVNGTPRIVNLTSLGHTFSYKYYEPTNKLNGWPNNYYTWIRYGNAKRASIEYTTKLAQLHPEIFAYSVHPGIITGTDLYTEWTQTPIFGGMYKQSLKLWNRLWGITCEQGSLATLKAAWDPKVGAKESGGYIVEGGFVSKSSKVSRKQKNIDRTWSENIRMLAEKGFINESEYKK